jgi:hypothetical protein
MPAWVIRAAIDVNLVLWLIAFSAAFARGSSEHTERKWIVGGGLACAALLQHAEWTQRTGMRAFRFWRPKLPR